MSSRGLGVKGLRGSGSDSGSFYVKQYTAKSFLVRTL
jgi:hypothetical protein